MNKSKIEWCDYTINPIKGLCQGGCWYCYARRMYKRFKWPQEVTYRPGELNKIATIKKPSRIFIGSTHDLLGEWIPDKWIFDIITKLQTYPQHTFLLLTKNPLRYTKFTFRDNFWCGITNDAKEELGKKFAENVVAFRNKKNTFISFEPLLGDWGEIPSNCKWVIIGALTGPQANTYYPREQWIRRIINEADRLNIPIFMKDNLRKYWEGEFRQEFPKFLTYIRHNNS